MDKRDEGVTPLPEGDEISWTREDASAEEVSLITNRAAGVNYRVRTLQGRPDGTGAVTTYSVPGRRLEGWLSQLRRPQDEEAEVVLSVEVVMECPDCDTENLPAATTCAGCGHQLEPHVTSETPVQQWLPQSVPQVLNKGGMGYCFLGCAMVALIVAGAFLSTIWLGGRSFTDLIQQMFGR